MDTMNEFLGWRTPIEWAKAYTNSINNFLSSEDKFNNFRQSGKDYTTILEHITEQGGQTYLNYTKTNYSELLEFPYLEEFKKNDIVGNPHTYTYESIGDINPTTLRYIKFAGDIFHKFGDLINYNFIEIGAGYGGLTRILNSIYKFNSITLFDLPEALSLQKKYLSKFNITPQTYTINDNFNIKKNTLIVSNYAWCECDKETRDLYVEKIIKNCDRAYMIVYDVDIKNELQTLEGKVEITNEILDACKIVTIEK